MDAFLILFGLMIFAFAALVVLVVAMVIVAKILISAFVKNIEEEMNQMHWNRK